jgi:hypothetical protein
MFSNVTFSKSDVAILAVLLACGTATMIEAHNRVLIDPPTTIEMAAPTTTPLATNPDVMLGPTGELMVPAEQFSP